MEEYLQWEIEVAMYGHPPTEEPHGLDHLVHLHRPDGSNSWLAQHTGQNPSAGERLLSFVGEVIRQTGRELPEKPNLTIDEFRGGEESESSWRFGSLSEILYQRHEDFLKAAGACRSDRDFQKLKDEALNRKLPQHEYLVLAPTFAGRLWYEQRSRHISQDNQAFIAMWFPSSQNKRHAEMAGLREVMEGAIRDAGYSPYSVITDDSISGGIDDKIIAQIRQSRFLIADLTDEESQGRRNVYYEAGFAYGLRLEIIYSCQRQQFEQWGAAFDIQQRDMLQWDSDRLERADGFRQRLQNRIEARLSIGPLKQAEPT